MEIYFYTKDGSYDSEIKSFAHYETRTIGNCSDIGSYFNSSKITKINNR